MAKLQNEAAKTIVGATVIDDILVLTALAFTQHFSAGSFEWSVAEFILLMAVAFIVISTMRDSGLRGTGFRNWMNLRSLRNIRNLYLRILLGAIFFVGAQCRCFSE